MSIEKLVSGVDEDDQLASDGAGVAAAVNALIDVTEAQSDGIEQLNVAVDAITADPANAVTQIFVGAQEMFLTTGTATLSALSSRLPVWLLPTGSNVYLSFAFKFPSHWSAISFTFVYCNTTANAGNVVFSGGVYSWAIGDTINSAPAEQSVIDAAPSIALTSKSATTTTSVAVTPSKTASVRVARLGASGSNSLPNNVALIGIIMNKVT